MIRRIPNDYVFKFLEFFDDWAFAFCAYKPTGEYDRTPELHTCIHLNVHDMYTWRYYGELPGVTKCYQTRTQVSARLPKRV